MKMFWSPAFFAGVAFSSALFAFVLQLPAIGIIMSCLGAVHTFLYNQPDDGEE